MENTKFLACDDLADCGGLIIGVGDLCSLAAPLLTLCPSLLHPVVTGLVLVISAYRSAVQGVIRILARTKRTIRKTTKMTEATREDTPAALMN